MRAHYRAMYLEHAQRSLFAARAVAAKSRIKDFLATCPAPSAGFSGGKDSTAVLILLAAIGRTDTPVFTQADDLDWPDKRAHCNEVVDLLGFRDYEYLDSPVSALEQFAAMDFVTVDRINERRVFFGTTREYARRRARSGVILGLRAEESKPRRITWRRRGASYDVKGDVSRCLPIGDWTGMDVFSLIVSSGTPYFHIYDRDDISPPHELRLAWMLNPAFLSKGAATFLRRHYPQQFYRLCAVNPALRRFA